MKTQLATVARLALVMGATFGAGACVATEPVQDSVAATEGQDKEESAAASDPSDPNKLAFSPRSWFTTDGRACEQRASWSGTDWRPNSRLGVIIKRNGSSSPWPPSIALSATTDSDGDFGRVLRLQITEGGDYQAVTYDRITGQDGPSVQFSVSNCTR